MARLFWFASATACAVTLAAGPGLRAETLQTLVEVLPTASLASPPLPDPEVFPIQLVLDDDSAEATVGVLDGGGVRQFLAFQQFAAPGEPFRLHQVWILFPNDPAVPAGGAIEIGVFRDGDGDPTNGATLLTSWATTVLVADGVTFSIYTLPAPIAIEGLGDILIGFANRYITSGGPPANDVLLDTTTSAGRSWLAVWDGADPPSPLALPGSLATLRLDDLALGGNWMIRAFGVPYSLLEVPALAPPSAVVLAVLIALAAVVLNRRRARVEVVR